MTFFLIQNIQNYLQLSKVRGLKYCDSSAVAFLQKGNRKNCAKIKFILSGTALNVEQKILKTNLFKQM